MSILETALRQELGLLAFAKTLSTAALRRDELRVVCSHSSEDTSTVDAMLHETALLLKLKLGLMASNKALETAALERGKRRVVCSEICDDEGLG